MAITVRLQAGFPLGEVKSHHHNVSIDTAADDVRVIKLADGVVPADRDFELTWKPAAEIRALGRIVSVSMSATRTTSSPS